MVFWGYDGLVVGGRMNGGWVLSRSGGVIGKPGDTGGW
jgi:hypothetical protein